MKQKNPNRSPQSEDIVCQDEAGQSNTGGLVATKVSRHEGKHGNGTHKPKLTASEDTSSSAPNDILTPAQRIALKITGTFQFTSCGWSVFVKALEEATLAEAVKRIKDEIEFLKKICIEAKLTEDIYKIIKSQIKFKETELKALQEQT